MRILTISCTTAITIAFSSPASAALLITGVVDGNESGGIPKAIELYATTAIPDLSAFSLARYTNGGSTLSSETELPSVPLAQGSFFYVTGTTSSDVYLTNAGFTVGLSGQAVVNVNGDDLLAVTDGSATLLDLFGRVGQGDTDFYENSVALRSNSSITPDPDGSIDAADNFTITGWTDTTTFASQFGTFSPVPEPATSLLGALGLLGLLRRRR